MHRGSGISMAVYLSMSKGHLGGKEANLRNSIKVRFVNTILVESQSSIPVGISMINSLINSLVAAYQGWLANPFLSTCRPRQKG